VGIGAYTSAVLSVKTAHHAVARCNRRRPSRRRWSRFARELHRAADCVRTCSALATALALGIVIQRRVQRMGFHRLRLGVSQGIPGFAIGFVRLRPACLRDSRGWVLVGIGIWFAGNLVQSTYRAAR